MSIQRYRNDNPRTASEIANAIKFELQQIDPSAPVVLGTQNYAYINSVAATLSSRQEQSLNELYDAAYITDATGEELTKKAGGIGVERQDAVAATGVLEFTRDSPATTDRVVQSGTRASTGGNEPAVFETTQSATIDGPRSETDSTNYTTSNTSNVTKTTYTIDVDYRETLDVEAELATNNNSYSAHLDIVDVTNGATIAQHSTTNTSLTAFGPTTYDVSGLSGSIDVEFQIRISNSSGTAELDNAQISVPGQTRAVANAICTETGQSGNVGAETITVLVDKPAGVDGVTNPEPMGDPSYSLTDGTTPLRNGQPREGDVSLRKRALESTAIGGAGTAEATELALENIDDVISADVFTNRSSSTVNGVDPWHTEIRVYGGNTNDITQRLYEVLPLGTLKTLQGGVNGTLNETTLTVSDLYGDLTIPITRPTETALEITVDLVHDASYAGTTDVKNSIVGYIGGTTTDARTVTGLGQGDDVIVNEVENVAEDVIGVDAVTSSIIGTGSGDATTTDSDGVQVYSVSDSEVATIEASNITVNETAR